MLKSLWLCPKICPVHMYMYISNTIAVISTHEHLSGGGESKKDCHSDGVHVPACVPDSKMLLFYLSTSYLLYYQMTTTCTHTSTLCRRTQNMYIERTHFSTCTFIEVPTPPTEVPGQLTCAGRPFEPYTRAKVSPLVNRAALNSVLRSGPG